MIYTYAQILAGRVENTIALDDEGIADAGLMAALVADFDYLLRVDNRDPQPSIGWTYDPETDEFTYGESRQG